MRRRSFLKSIVGTVAGLLGLSVKTEAEPFNYKPEVGSWDGIRLIDSNEMMIGNDFHGDFDVEAADLIGPKLIARIREMEKDGLAPIKRVDIDGTEYWFLLPPYRDKL